MSKLHGDPKPWSEDKVFQSTYFCNVRREDDTVTKWIRREYPQYIEEDMFELNTIFSRLINWPDTLREVGFIIGQDDFQRVADILESKKDTYDKVFGDAYIVSTNGLAMPKAQYVCEYLLPAAYERLGAGSGWRGAWGSGPLSLASQGLTGVRGLGTFMIGQVIADLKNTPGHPLQKAYDWWTWATPGPGSLRGMSWLVHGCSDAAESRWKKNFPLYLGQIRAELISKGCKIIEKICNQDLQNCLCEFDKYCRVATGAGRSKRGYQGV